MACILQRLLYDLWGGVIAFFLSAVLIISYASVLSPGTQAIYFNGACAIAAIGSVVFGMYMALASAVPWTLATVDLFTAPILETMVQRVTAVLGENTEAGLSTLLIAILLGFGLLGSAMAGIGYAQYVSVVHYLPYPGICYAANHDFII